MEQTTQFSQDKDTTSPTAGNAKRPVSPDSQAGAKVKDPQEDKEKQRERRLVEEWCKRIHSAKKKWDKDFRTMREDMKFARGIQWDGQKDLMDQRYVANITLRNINQGVANIYARNPEIQSQRRGRMDFELWDGKEETIQAAAAAGPVNPVAMMLIKDYSEGQLWRDLVDRVGDTVTHIAQYMWDTCQPDFKLQMKQLVRRVKTCGVGYVQVNYVDGLEGTLSTSETESTITDRAKRIKHTAGKLADNKITDSAPDILTMANTAESMLASVASGDTGNVNQRITFDFLPATAVIIDPRCRHLKGFVGARWLAVERCETLDTVNAFYETQIKSSDAKSYSSDGVSSQDPGAGDASTGSDAATKRVCIWDVYDLDSKSCFVICDGHKEFVQEPEPVMPETNHFWPIVALTFNDVETEPSDEVYGSIFPPSDVSMLRSAQKEWNRTRNALRSHRVANTPAYLTGKGWLTDGDKAKINDHEDSAVVELEGAQMGSDINKLLAPFNHSPLQPQLYDTAPLSQDIQLAGGTQEADLGRAQPKVTATGATIAEQAKTTVAASNSDDIDEFLSTIACMEGEIILRYFTLDSAKRIAGRGAVLPQQNREDFINEILLTTKAASSGRPNQAMEVSKMTQLAPMLIQAGANPIAVIEALAKAIDDRMDVSKFYPVAMIPATMAAQSMQAQAQPSGPQQPQTGQSGGQPKQLPNGAPQQSLVPTQ